MNIFVGNLPVAATEEDLSRLFTAYGTVINALIMRDFASGEPLGHGHVYLMPEAAGYRAILELDRSKLKGRSITVRECIYRTRHERRHRRFPWLGRERRLTELRRQSNNMHGPKTNLG